MIQILFEILTDKQLSLSELQLIINKLIHDVNPSQLGEAHASSAFRRSSVIARSISCCPRRRGPVVHRATNK